MIAVPTVPISMQPTFIQLLRVAEWFLPEFSLQEQDISVTVMFPVWPPFCSSQRPPAVWPASPCAGQVKRCLALLRVLLCSVPQWLPSPCSSYSITFFFFTFWQLFFRWRSTHKIWKHWHFAHKYLKIWFFLQKPVWQAEMFCLTNISI